MKYVFEDGIEFAKSMDSQDPLSKFKDRFYYRSGMIYMDGNSLGLCSKDAEKMLLHVLEVWKKDAINIWSVEDSKYFLYPSVLAGMIAPLIGANKEEVTITNSTTVNLHQCLATLYKPTDTRFKIVVDDLNFPTDRYAVDSEVILHGLDPDKVVKVVKTKDGRTIKEDDVIAAMTPDVALVLMPAAMYRSSQILDLPRLTAAAHKRGIIIGFDLCHSIGAVPYDFNSFQPDFAIWCNYKYLNGGPGTVGGMYINKIHLDKEPGLAGWFGNNKMTQFQLNQKFEPAEDADRYLIGTPPLLSMAALEGTLKIIQEAGIEAIRKKSLKITAYLMYLIDTKLVKYGFSVGNPREDEHRGGHVALEHEEAWRICLALKARDVIPDFREPNVVRLAPVALYTTYVDIWRMVQIIEDIAKNKIYEQYDNTRALVV